MTPTNFDVEILKKTSFYKLPTTPLLGNGLFAHIVKLRTTAPKRTELLYTVVLSKCALLKLL